MKDWRGQKIDNEAHSEACRQKYVTEDMIESISEGLVGDQDSSHIRKMSHYSTVHEVVAIWPLHSTAIFA